MSLSTATLKRLPKIKSGLILGLNREQIGASCGVTEKTIDRDVSAWVESGLFDIWLKEEFVRLHPIMLKKNIEKVYDNICRLVGQMIKRKLEVKEEIYERIEHVTIDATEDEDTILSKAAAILERKAKTQKIH